MVVTKQRILRTYLLPGIIFIKLLIRESYMAEYTPIYQKPYTEGFVNEPLIPCSYENNEITECMNATYSNGNANKLFTYNFLDKIMKVKKIAVLIK